MPRILSLLLSLAMLVTPAAAVRAEEPLKLVVSLDEQRMTVWRGTEKVAESPISSGKAGHDTPTGIFSVLEKREFHRSNIYSNAPMPFMQRLTWDGIALHEGKLPGYPASHGCVRLPAGFAEELFKMTRRGVHVVIGDAMAEPRSVESPVLPQPAMREYSPEDDQWLSAHLAGRRFAGNPAQLVSTSRMLLPVADKVSLGPATGAPLRILLTRRDMRYQTADIQRLLLKLGFDPGPVDGAFGVLSSRALVEFQKAHGLPATGALTREMRAAVWKAAGEPEPPEGLLLVRKRQTEIFRAAYHIDEPQRPLGAHLLHTHGFDRERGRTRWAAISLPNRLDAYEQAVFGIGGEGFVAADIEGTLSRLRIPEEAMRRVARLLTPGSSIAISDTGLGRYTGEGTDFIVATRR